MLIPIENLAEQLGRSTRTLKRWSAAGILPPMVRIGRRLLAFKSTDLAKWEAKLPTEKQRGTTEEIEV